MAVSYYGVVLRRGSAGPDVALVQTILNALGAAGQPIRRLGVDGKFGAGTESAVRQFQTLQGLAVDGKVGANTWARLNTAYTAATGKDTAGLYPGISLRRGDRGAAVVQAQQKLAATRPGLGADGIFGANTQAAVRTFQARSRLTVDGILGKNTWAVLFAAR